MLEIVNSAWSKGNNFHIHFWKHFFFFFNHATCYSTNHHRMGAFLKQCLPTFFGRSSKETEGHNVQWNNIVTLLKCSVCTVIILCMEILHGWGVDSDYVVHASCSGKNMCAIKLLRFWTSMLWQHHLCRRCRKIKNWEIL